MFEQNSGGGGGHWSLGKGNSSANDFRLGNLPKGGKVFDPYHGRFIKRKGGAVCHGCHTITLQLFAELDKRRQAKTNLQSRVRNVRDFCDRPARGDLGATGIPVCWRNCSHARSAQKPGAGTGNALRANCWFFGEQDCRGRRTKTGVCDSQKGIYRKDSTVILTVVEVLGEKFTGTLV